MTDTFVNGDICSQLYISPRLPKVFLVTRLPKWVITTPPQIFAFKPPILMILVLEDRYWSLFSHSYQNSTSSLSFDITMTFLWPQSHKRQILQIFAENIYADFQNLPKILGICNFDIFSPFLLIMKENYNYSIHKKFVEHSTNIFGSGAKINIVRWQLPLYP